MLARSQPNISLFFFLFLGLAWLDHLGGAKVGSTQCSLHEHWTKEEEEEQATWSDGGLVVNDGVRPVVAAVVRVTGGKEGRKRKKACRGERGVHGGCSTVGEELGWWI
jgi:hypothetical protein